MSNNLANHLPFADALQERVLIFDGAMGTELYKRNIFTNRNFDELCLSAPDLVRSIHQEYCDAGADVLTTNSFGANRTKLNKFGFGDVTDQINAAAVTLAREVAASAERTVYVAGSVGPVELASDASAAIVTTLAEQISFLIAAGVDLVIFETLPTRATVENAAAAWAKAGLTSQVPFILSVVVDERGESVAGEPLERLLAPVPEPCPQPLAWGLNCGMGPDHMLSATELALRQLDRPLIVQPNAGLPRAVENRHIYMCSPEYITTYAKRFIDTGARGVGGCCGTSPDHIREISRALKPLTRKRLEICSPHKNCNVPAKQPVPFAQRSQLAARLAANQWVTTVEIVPPRGYDLDSVLAKVKVCREHGVHAINIPDGPRASSRMSPLVTAMRIQHETQLEAILHFCCRDRNLIGMQADLLGCASADVRNILFITGDPPKLGDYPFASGVFDADSIGMTRLQAQLNHGIDLGGQSIEPPTQAVIGVGADPNALDLDRELERLRLKTEAGAEFFITQPVFDPEALLRFLDRAQAFKLPVIAGIWPLASYRNALFMRNEVPGVVVPDAIMAQMAAVENKDDQRRVGIEIARNSVARIRDRINGIQVSAPFGNVGTALAVLTA